MNPATLYDLVLLLHLCADIVLVVGLLAASLALAALSLQSGNDATRSQRLAATTRRWHRAVSSPALLVAWACGLWLAWRAGWFASGWLHAKLCVVLGLSALHGVMSAALRRAASTSPTSVSRAWRAVPAAVLVATALIVWLAMFKPF